MDKDIAATKQRFVFVHTLSQGAPLGHLHTVDAKSIVLGSKSHVLAIAPELSKGLDFETVTLGSCRRHTVSPDGYGFVPTRAQHRAAATRKTG